MNIFRRKFYTALCLFLILITCVFASSCAKTSELEQFILELRCNLYYGECESVKLNAHYGFDLNDNTASTNPIYGIYFHLSSTDIDNVSRTVSYVENDKTYTAEFKLDPVTNKMTAFIEIADFNKNEFAVSILEGSENHEIKLTSLLPENTLTYHKAMEVLENTQKPLIDAYKNEDGSFNASIIMRVIVKKEKPYWYVGFKKPDGNLKAFLLDGITGETLAIREVL